MPTPLLLLGELHDAPEHQLLQQDAVRQLAKSQQLAALVMEMIEQGRSTDQLPSEASEAQVRLALGWNEERNSGSWQWSVYGPVVMAAVRAQVPVVGGNLLRAQMRPAMADASLDSVLSEPALQRQREAIRQGHCQLLPEAQIAPMTRIQLARDRALAATAVSRLASGRTVLLIAGNAHVQRDVGIPRHLPPNLSHRVVLALSQDAASATAADPASADRVWVTPQRPAKDYCAEVKKQMGQ